MPKGAKGMKMKPWCRCYPGELPPRLLRAFLLLLLCERPAHGYELLERLRGLGLDYADQEIGYVYRTLRAMEREGLIGSEWDTTGPGPAKRVCTITAQGVAMLKEWAEALERIRESLEVFARLYEERKVNVHELESL